MKLEWPKNKVIFNLSYIACEGQEFPIINIEGTDTPYDRLLTEFNALVPRELLDKLPFNDSYRFSSVNDIGGIHLTTIRGEFLKLKIPKNCSYAEILNSQREVYIKITFTNHEIGEDKIVLLSSIEELPQFEGNLDSNSNFISHVELDSIPHLDTFLSVNLGHTRLQCNRLLKNKCTISANVTSNNYIDSSGRFYYLGDSYDN